MPFGIYKFIKRDVNSLLLGFDDCKGDFLQIDPLQVCLFHVGAGNGGASLLHHDYARTTALTLVRRNRIPMISKRLIGAPDMNA